jgi:hypothetical protein
MEKRMCRKGETLWRRKAAEKEAEKVVYIVHKIFTRLRLPKKKSEHPGSLSARLFFP